MSDASQRILEACCTESTIDRFDQAARVIDVVSQAHLARFKRTPAPVVPAQQLETEGAK